MKSERRGILWRYEPGKIDLAAIKFSITVKKKREIGADIMLKNYNSWITKTRVATVKCKSMIDQRTMWKEKLINLSEQGEVHCQQRKSGGERNKKPLSCIGTNNS